MSHFTGNAHANKTIRRFCSEDWYGFSGCESFADGSDPYIYEMDDNTLVVADANGMLLMISNVDDDVFEFSITCNFTPQAAKLVLRLLPGNIGEMTGEQLTELGFEEV